MEYYFIHSFSSSRLCIVWIIKAALIFIGEAIFHSNQNSWLSSSIENRLQKLRVWSNASYQSVKALSLPISFISTVQNLFLIYIKLIPVITLYCTVTVVTLGLCSTTGREGYIDTAYDLKLPIQYARSPNMLDHLSVLFSIYLVV